MRPKLFVILALFTFSCNERNIDINKLKQNIIDSTVPRKINKTDTLLKQGTFIAHSTGYKDISKFCDTTINKIRFNDCHTITKLFGNKFELLPDIDDLPSLEVVNKNKTQLLTMFMWNGSAKCNFEQYQVEYLTSTKKFLQKPFMLEEEIFKSSREISLGITLSDLKLKIGMPNEIKHKNGHTIFSYQQYNDLYFADYYFKANKLIKFRYGYEYP